MDILNSVLCEVFRLSEADLRDDLTMGEMDSWDSLTHMTLVTSIEAALPIEFSMDDIMSMTDVGSIRSVVNGKLT